jgi:uncharacterized membrane protein YdbT with pleckstrin-like domain
MRLIEERGIIGKRIIFIPLNKVQDVTCGFGILGKIFGFGDLEKSLWNLWKNCF